MLTLKREKQTHFERGELTRTVFSNGAVLVHNRTKKTKGAMISVWFLVGSRDESKKQEGLCHFLEHMMFKGGSSIKGSELLSMLEGMGAELNAFTTKEYVSFDLSCLAEDLEQIFPLFLDLIFSPSFSADEFKKEKDVVLQEIREDRDDHELEAEEELFLRSFNWDLGHRITGTIKSVSAFTPKDLKNFYNEHYIMPKMCISMVGDFKTDKFEKLLLKLFKAYGFTKKHKPIRRKMEKGFGQIKPHKLVLKRSLENPLLYLSMQAAPIDSDYKADFMLLNHYLSEGMSSRFFKALREEEGLVYSVSSYVNNFSDNGSLVISLSTRAKNLTKVQNKIQDILADIALHGIGEHRLLTCKKQILASFQMAFDDMDELGSHIGRGELYRGHVLSFKEIAAGLSKVSNERIKFITQVMLEKGIARLIVR